MISNSAVGKWILRCLMLLLLTSVFTVVCVRESQRNGRLCSAPNYDDCYYFQSGALLLKALKTDGLEGFVKFVGQGLHSPYSTFLAAASFAIFGPFETSPYYGDALVVLLYLAGIGYLLRELSMPAWLLALGLFLTPPFITMGVVEFRPDIAWAVVTGFGVVWIIVSEKIFQRPGTAALAAFFFALALLIKPSTFAMTTLLFTGAVMTHPLGRLFARRKEDSSGSVFWSAVCFLLVLLLVAGPYWWFFGKDIWQYFWDSSFGVNKQVWSYTGSLSESLLFYITGGGFRSNIAFAGLIISFPALGCTVFLVLRRPELRWKIFSLFACTAVALVVNTLASMKHPFLGGGIYGVWLFSGAFAMAETCKTLFGGGQVVSRERRWATALLGVCFLTALIGYHWPEYSYWPKDRSENYRAANDHMQALLDRYKISLPKSILFTQAGPIVMEDAGLWYAFRNLSVNLGAVWVSRTEKEFEQNYPNYEWLVIQEPGVMGSAGYLPSEALLPRYLEIVRADPNYQVISEFTAMDGKKVWIYAHK